MPASLIVVFDLKTGWPVVGKKEYRKNETGLSTPFNPFGSLNIDQLPTRQKKTKGDSTSSHLKWC